MAAVDLADLRARYTRWRSFSDALIPLAAATAAAGDARAASPSATTEHQRSAPLDASGRTCERLVTSGSVRAVLVTAPGGSGGSGERARLRAHVRGLHALHDALHEIKSDLVGPAALSDDDAVVRADLDLGESDGDDEELETSAVRTAVSSLAAALTATHCVVLTKRTGARKAQRLGVEIAPTLLELMSNSAQLVNHVVHVAARGAAAAQGVRVGDVLVDVNGVPLFAGTVSAASVAKAIEFSAYPQTVRFHRPSLAAAALARGSGDGEVGVASSVGAADAPTGPTARRANLTQRFPQTWRRRRLAVAHGSALRFPTAALLRCGGGRVALALSTPLIESEDRRVLAGTPAAAGGRLFNRSAPASAVARRCARRLNVVPAVARAEPGATRTDGPASASASTSTPRAWFPGVSLSLLKGGSQAANDGEGFTCDDEQYVTGGSDVLPRVERGVRDWSPALVVPADNSVMPYAIEIAAKSEWRDIARVLRASAPRADHEADLDDRGDGAYAERVAMP